MSQRTIGTGVVVAALLVCAAVVLSGLQRATDIRGLPLSETAIIREQAAAKHLDPALIAAVIYTESRFDPRTSPAGAEGLMQITPETAQFIARTSGGTAFTVSDLATPQVNISYGAWYLRYLLKQYGGNEKLALAAYNGGLANVDRWVARAIEKGGHLTSAEIPFPETREYVQRVLSAQREYRATYPRELGL